MQAAVLKTLANPRRLEIVRACDIMHEVLMRRLTRLGTLSSTTSQFPAAVLVGAVADRV